MGNQTNHSMIVRRRNGVLNSSFHLLLTEGALDAAAETAIAPP